MGLRDALRSDPNWSPLLAFVLMIFTLVIPPCFAALATIKGELGWKRAVSFDEGLARTVDWYLANRAWIEGIRSGEYLKWIEANYGSR